MRAGLYSRVSTDDQAKNYSLPSQLKECRKRANELGATNIIEYIDDGHSGAFLDRPGMNQLRDAVRRKELDVVICLDPDRLARNLTHQLIITEEIDTSGAQLEFINFDWQNTPEGRLFYSIRGAISAYEREKIKERTQRGKRAKAEAGKIVTPNEPYGYRWDKETSSYIIDEEEAKMVRQVYKWYTEERLGLLQIAERLALKEFPTRTGRRSWGTSAVNGILTNEIYIGVSWAFKTYRKKIGPKKYERGVRPKEEWIPVPVPPIIDPATFERAQLQAKANSKNSRRNAKYDFLLRGLLECPSCGNKYKIAHSRHGQSAYVYYRCFTGKVDNVKYMDNPPGKCPSRTIPAHLVEDLFWEFMKKLSNEPDLLSFLSEQAQAKIQDTVDISSELAKLDSIEAKLGQAKDRMLRLLRNDAITEDDAEKELKDIRKRLLALSVERRKLEAYNPQSSDIELLYNEIRNLEHAVTFEEKRRSVVFIVDKVIAQRVDSYWTNHQEPEIEITVKLNI